MLVENYIQNHEEEYQNRKYGLFMRVHIPTLDR